MGEKISDYINSASATPNNQSLFDLSEFDGSSYESVKWELSDFITWITNNVSFSEVYTFHNNSGATLEKGTPVKIDSLQSGVVAVNDYQILPNNTSSQIFVAKEQILNGAQGVFFKSGIITDVDTSTFSVGQTIYYNYTTNAITNVYASDVIYLGIVITSAVDGSIFVAPEKAEMTDSNIYSTDGTLTGNRIMDGANNELLFQTMGKFSVHSHANGVDNVVFEVRSDATYHSFIIKDHNTGVHILACRNGAVEISDAYFLPDVDGSANRVIKTDGAGQWGYGVIQDNGTTAGIGATPDANKLLTMSTNLSDGIVLFNTNTGAGTIKGLNIITQGASSGTNIAVYGSSSNSTSTNIGAYFVASGTNPYSVQLQDGTEANGRFLSCDANGRANWVDLPASSGGILGISDSSGAYTYYSDFASALASASAGDTIEMFADIEETTNTTVTLIDGITINGNGHTYTLNVDNSADAFTFTTANGTAYFNNIKVVRTGRATGTASGVIGNFVNNTIKCQGAVFINDYGRGFRGDQGSIYNAHIISVEHGIYAPFSSKNLYNCNIEVSSSSALGIYTSSGSIYNCYVKAVSQAINCSSGAIYNSIGISTNNYGIVSNGEIYNSIGQSNSGIGISGQRLTNCVGISNTNFGTNAGSSRNCTFISTSGGGAFRGSHQNATIISSSNYGINEPIDLDSCYIESSSNVAVSFRDNSNIKNSSINCKWNNAGGHGTRSSILQSNPIVTNTSIKVANASAYCINMYVGSTLRYANNSFQGATTPVNTTNVTQGIVNTSDSQGNILI